MKENLDVIRKVTWKYVKKYPWLEFDETFSEVCTICLQANAKYNEERGQKTTFFWTVAENHIKNKIRQQQTRANKEMEFTEFLENFLIDENPNPEEILIQKEEWELLKSRLSEKAKNVIDFISGTKEYLPIHTPRNCRGVISRLLVSKNGWKQNDVWMAFREIKEALR